MKKKSKYGMPPPASRLELEHNVNLILEDVDKSYKAGGEEFIANKFWATIPHLRKLKFLPNGRIDVSTVNESLRLQANMMDWQKYMSTPSDDFRDEE